MPQTTSMRSRFMICMTILVSAVLIIVVFLGPMMTTLFPSLSDRTDFFLHADMNQKQKQLDQQFHEKNMQFSGNRGIQNDQQQKYGQVHHPHASKEQESYGRIPNEEVHQSPSVEKLSSQSSESSAAEKLQCPSDVLSFVINATDVKDECEGLRKAFDQTCGVHHQTTKQGNGRRHLLENGNTKWHDPMMQYFHERLKTLKTRTLRRLQSDEAPPQVEGKYDEKPVSPSLPTANADIAENTLNDALTLHADLEDIAKAIDGIKNQTHHVDEIENAGIAHPLQDKKGHGHDHEEEKDETSAGELKNTAVAVSAVINSPQALQTQQCCRSILKVFHQECDSPEEEEFNDKRLFVIVCVIALCGVVKSLIRHFKLRWIPEAGGCILVGMLGGFFMRFLPTMDFGFQHDMFLRLMVPPIVFEAALNINKRSFSEMAVPIIIFSVWGTFMSTLLTAAIVYYGTRMTTLCSTIPFVESLAFGALISSIDPIAVLSVLNNMGMSDKDPIYVLIFGESLLNDGVAIVLFQTLVHFMDEKIVIDGEACWLATLHFLVISFGSLITGLTCGVGATVYFWLMKGIQTPLVEVIMFLCWAFIPYYICDGVDWSGIVAIVAAGFFMDIYVIGSRTDPLDTNGETLSPENGHANMVPSRNRGGVFSQEGFLSSKAMNHIGFVSEINAALMETAIFAYLGIFLFSKRYHWNLVIPIIAVVSCIGSRSIMVAFSSVVSNAITRIGDIGKRSAQCGISRRPGNNNNANAAIIDSRMQVVLIFAGLRGAMSFALVETVPMYDQSTGEGSRYKPELKSMTSACIVFTVFILGGYTFYLLENLGMAPMTKEEEALELVSLMSSKDDADEEDPWDTVGVKQRSSRTIRSRSPSVHTSHRK